MENQKHITPSWMTRYMFRQYWMDTQPWPHLTIFRFQVWCVMCIIVCQAAVDDHPMDPKVDHTFPHSDCYSFWYPPLLDKPNYHIVACMFHCMSRWIPICPSKTMLSPPYIAGISSCLPTSKLRFASKLHCFWLVVHPHRPEVSQVSQTSDISATKIKGFTLRVFKGAWDLIGEFDKWIN